ncbi:MAG: DNA topoisomerase III [Betaproteobacteria bacterium]|nr:DNA topoisomerase III [Betaproteobacteria bacterium]
MTKKLIIAEKPSVAADIARALGGFARKGDYFEGEQYVLASAVGHLLKLAVPEDYDVKKGKWSFAHLPIIPPHFELSPIDRNEARLNLLLRLIRRKDVAGLINACDAGREGELIFRYIVQHAKAKKPIERLWLQSMTQAAIREGFAAMRLDREMRPLADAAKCRSEADWLVGINGTRAMTAFNSRAGGFYLTTVGRVQTPTLAILVEREEKIKRFVPRDYFEVHATFAAKAGEYAGRWFDEKFSHDKKPDDGDLKAERLWERARAAAIRANCEGKRGAVEEERKASSQLSPLLYDLTSLQRDANGRFGFSAKTTLSIAQALYEKHKVLTYPRTDSRALPQDYLDTVRATLAMLAGSKARKASGLIAPYAGFAAQVLKEGWVRPNKRIFDNAKISDHFAIIPTLEAPKQLNEAEARLYDMVVRRFLAVFYPAAESLITTRITRVEGEAFRTDGRMMLKPGWLSVYGREAETEETASLVPLDGERVKTRGIEVRALQTRPPARFTEATLLAAMEGAGKLVEDEDLREAMREKGLGTPATRAAIIEGLIYEEYIHRSGRELVPTPKAFSLLFALKHFGIGELSSPELTGAWEFKLREMEHGRLARKEFMVHIVDTTREMVERIRNGNIPDEVFATLAARCPRCGGTVQENYRKFQCQSCDFAVWRVVSGRELAPEEVEQLIEKRVLGPLSGFRSRLGRAFAAALKLSPEFKIEFDFGQAGSADGNGADEAPDFSGQQSLGPCPKCRARVFEQPMAYLCENSVGAQRNCGFRTGRVILQRHIEPAQVRKLLATGKTDLLHRFISKKGRPFSAFLARLPDGKIGFEFAPRPARSAAKPEARAPGEAGASGRLDALRPTRKQAPKNLKTTGESAPKRRRKTA